MLTDVDRIVFAVRERRPVIRALRTLLGAEVVATSHLPIWAAKRTTLRAGVSEIEVLSPKGVGAVANFIGPISRLTSTSGIHIVISSSR